MMPSGESTPPLRRVAFPSKLSIRASVSLSPPEFIRLRGVRQNNLKGFDLDVPLGRFIVVTGLSGAGKSSLVFDTLHAEGQRRYVETFSAYTRQFLDLLDKPKVDSVENIRPSIAIQQTNTVKTSRSTVGTMTELTDFFKVWFSHVATCYDPATGQPVEDDNPQSIWTKTHATHPGATLLVAFTVKRPDNFSWDDIITPLQGQGYTRALLVTEADANPASKSNESTYRARTLDELRAATGAPLLGDSSTLVVVQDRLAITTENKARFLEAVETALHFGQNEVLLFSRAATRAKSATAKIQSDSFALAEHYSRGLHSPVSGRTFRPATPGLFSFNSPVGACPTCRGFGRIIDIDYRLAIPDHSLSIEGGAIRAWEGAIYSESKRDLIKFARRVDLPTDVPFGDLTAEQQAFIIDGSPGYDGETNAWPEYWYGLKGFFRYLEKTTYKMHVRVFLSRYRAYNTCTDCHGTRLQPEALCWQWQGHTLPALYQMPISELVALVAQSPHHPRHPQVPRNASQNHQRDLAHDSIVTRLRYLEQVGLGYLTLDRTSRTLSGGEVQRVNLTSCLGTSLVDTLFVLDEPSVGLHPRDIDRLIGIIRTLTDAGNTVVVVEHDESMIRAADHVIEIGPEPGARGGEIVFQGNVSALLRHETSITGRYLSRREEIVVPALRRPIAVKSRGGRSAPVAWLRFKEVSKHNLRQVTFELPLARLVCLSGVSGSGKSTLLDNVIFQGLLAQRGQLTDDVAEIARITGADTLGEIVLVDQSPLSRTPRSNPALYCEAWDQIRELFARTPASQAAGFNASSFSFNSGDGRCDNCQGLGSERVEMQFLSDVFVPCPICEGRRFKPEVLAIRYGDKSVSELLNTTVTEALEIFTEHASIRSKLASLDAVGLGYLTLGQPLNTLSGGESQRLKLVRYLSGYAAEPTRRAGNANVTSEKALLLLDEPTTGLHRHDVKCLLAVLQRIVAQGHSVVVIEHNLDVLKSADWILEIGPDAGSAGGKVVATGTPEEVAATETETAPYLRAALGQDEPIQAAAEDAAPYVSTATSEPPALRLIGARENNLQNISVTIPHRQFSVVTGVSGSGKSTLAFDIIFAEGQRRFMESMSPYARQFVEQLPRPDIDRLTGIPPTVAIEQRVTRGSRKSTVATITEVAQYLRLLYARLGVQHHPESDRPVTPLSPSQLRRLLDRTLASPAARSAKHLYLCAPLIRGRKGHHEPIVKWIERQGFELMRADGRLLRVDTFAKLDRYKEHDIEVVVADLKAPDKLKRPAAKRIGAALESALSLGKGACFLLLPDGKVLSWFSTTRTDIASGESFPELDPKHFSFNSPRGWCPTCRGHGRIYDWMLQKKQDEDEVPVEVTDALRHFDSDDLAGQGKACPTCAGERLNRIARAVKLPLKQQPAITLPQLMAQTPEVLLATLRQLELEDRGKLITQDIVPQIAERLRFLAEVGLDYLALDRPTDTLSGGEAQRIRLAAQLGSNLSGVLYVLDEPSIGLHARDNDRLIVSLQALRAKGNTLLVVEHDDVLMEQADRIIDLGPGAGPHGGQLLSNDTPANLKANAASLTGHYLQKGVAHPWRGSYRDVAEAARGGRKKQSKVAAKAKNDAPTGWLTLNEICFRNLQGESLRLPHGRLVMACGPSGAGKSTLFRDVLDPAVRCAIALRKAKLSGRDFLRHGTFASGDSAKEQPPFRDLAGGDIFKAVIEVDQSPIGKTPRSTPATYLGIFDQIRQFFASLPESKVRGYNASRFSFNTAGGRCELCGGAGRIKLEMAFMPDSYQACDNCGGTRFGAELADIQWKGKNIGQVLALTFDEAATFFDFHARLKEVCELMVACGLGYLTLGQSSPSLSGGEAQRLKLVTELTKGLQTYKERAQGIAVRNLYLLEEPTIGLHLSDCEKLIGVLHNLVDHGHTVVVIEHHLDLIAEADWVIELGPGGGPNGGQILYQGPLAGILKIKSSPTAPYLRGKFDAKGLRVSALSTKPPQHRNSH